MILHCGSKTLDLSTPVVMGVLNVTPDSFSDGGQYAAASHAIARAQQMLQEGAALIDIGGESTRPGAVEITVEEELRRVLPVVSALAKDGALVSIDTSKPEVMRAAVEAGAVLINDIRALRASGALAAAAATDAAVCLMHMQGEPANMQQQPCYTNVVAEVKGFLSERVRLCGEAGIAKERLLVDPGIGFGKTLEHNLELLAHLNALDLQVPLLIGVSRKSLIGTLTGRPLGERLNGGLALATAAILAGAKVVRTHDVAATVDAVKVAAVLKRSGYRIPN